MTADERERAGKPYAPDLYCLCDDWDCCGEDGGSWAVICVHCKQTWPCADYIATHTDAEVLAKKRYTNRRVGFDEWPGVEGTPNDKAHWMDDTLRGRQ